VLAYTPVAPVPEVHECLAVSGGNNCGPWDVDNKYCLGGSSTTIRWLRIQARLRSISSMDGAAVSRLVATAYARHFGKYTGNPFYVDWNRYSRAKLCSLARCAGGRQAVAVIRIFMLDPRVWSRGCPDLTIWGHPCVCTSLTAGACTCTCGESSSHTQGTSGGGGCSVGGSACANSDGSSSTDRCCHGKEGRVKLIEVKSQNDILSKAQEAWMMQLIARKVDVEVCKVLDDRTSSAALTDPQYRPQS
jgi:hypothetical protein